ncbi:MAG: hypothetical protein M0P31_13620 [Solirubrobacteraceae bacterium]|nr:hypothetical protein [Solirubrobacteraceae bacterium]
MSDDIYDPDWTPPKPHLWKWVPGRDLVDPEHGAVHQPGRWQPNTGDPEGNDELWREARERDAYEGP